MLKLVLIVCGGILAVLAVVIIAAAVALSRARQEAGIREEDWRWKSAR